MIPSIGRSDAYPPLIPTRSTVSPSPRGGGRGGARWIGAALLISILCACAESAGSTPRSHRVAIQGFLFAPDTLQVAVGDTVIWVNEDILPHTATSADGGWETGSIAGGDSAIVVMMQRGTQDYVCIFHPDMKGVVTVSGSMPRSTE